MKKFTQILAVLYLLLNGLVATAQYNISVIDTTVDGIVKFATVQTQNSKSEKIDSKSFLKNVLKAEKETEFYLYRLSEDDLGMTHEKYQQTFNGIKVEFGEFIVHKDKSGNIVSINGDFVPVPSAFRITPNIEFNDALTKAATSKKIKEYHVQDLLDEKSVEKAITKRGDKYELVIVKGNDNQLHLAYKANLLGDNIMDNFNGYLDCDTGDLVFVQPLVYQTNSTGTATTIYSGNRTITTDSYSGTFRLRETSRGGSSTSIQTFNYQRNPAYYTTDVASGVAAATDFADNDNTWTLAEYNNQNHDNAALDAHWGAEMTFDYFRTVHNRNSYDNNNGTIKNYVHARYRDGNGNIVDMDNAFWLDSYKSMFYGDGLAFGPTVSLDICGHEIGHGVCNGSVGNGTGLTYSKESGALNESFSDIWGACVEQWSTTGKQTWLLGEDVFAGGTRSMSNPNLFGQPDTYHGTNWANTECGTPSLLNDFCGVHTNSGVGNFWFFLLAQGGNSTNDIGNPYDVRGVGITSAARILYRTETYNLTSSSNYNDVRNQSISAATYLFGENSCEVMNTTNAWYAVGVGSPFQYTNVTLSGPSLLCSSGTYTVNNPSGTTVSWTCSGNITFDHQTGSSKTFSANGQGTGTIQAILTSNCGNVTLPTKTVWVGLPSTPVIVGNTSLTCSTYLYRVSDNSQVTWTVSGPLQISGTNYGYKCNIIGTGDGYGWIQATATNSCGSTMSEMPVEVICGYYLTFSPNPSNGQTTVSVVSADGMGSEGLSESAKSVSVTTVFDETEPWDMEVYTQNQLLKDRKTKQIGKSTTINTSNWPDGLYIVTVVYKGSQIIGKMIVKH